MDLKVSFRMKAIESIEFLAVREREERLGERGWKTSRFVFDGGNGIRKTCRPRQPTVAPSYCYSIISSTFQAPDWTAHIPFAREK